MKCDYGRVPTSNRHERRGRSWRGAIAVGVAVFFDLYSNFKHLFSSFHVRWCFSLGPEQRHRIHLLCFALEQDEIIVAIRATITSHRQRVAGIFYTTQNRIDMRRMSKSLYQTSKSLAEFNSKISSFKILRAKLVMLTAIKGFLRTIKNSCRLKFFKYIFLKILQDHKLYPLQLLG